MSEIKDETMKNPKRVAAGIKGAQAKKIKAELKMKETETVEKENIQLKSITKDDEAGETELVKKVQPVNIYISLCLIAVAGLGLYIYKSEKTIQQPTEQKKEIDPFVFN